MANLECDDPLKKVHWKNLLNFRVQQTVIEINPIEFDGVNTESFESFESFE